MNRIKRLRRRIIDIKYKQKDCHIGSCLSSLEIINDIYNKMKPGDRFVLSNGHAATALYVILEERGIMKKDIEKLEIHPRRDVKNGIYATTGSLGHGIGIACGMAIANPDSEVFCLMSDGEMNEGSVWEALRIAEDENLSNLHIYINANGWIGYCDIDVDKLEEVLSVYCPFLNIKVVRTNSDFGPYKGLEAHYKSLNEDEYKELVQNYEKKVRTASI